jgi:hypothetical protein
MAATGRPVHQTTAAFPPEPSVAGLVECFDVPGTATQCRSSAATARSYARRTRGAEVAVEKRAIVVLDTEVTIEEIAAIVVVIVDQRTARADR